METFTVLLTFEPVGEILWFPLFGSINNNPSKKCQIKLLAEFKHH